MRLNDDRLPVAVKAGDEAGDRGRGGSEARQSGESFRGRERAEVFVPCGATINLDASGLRRHR